MSLNLWLFHFINGNFHNFILDKIMIFIAVYSPYLFAFLMVYEFLTKRANKKIIIKMIITAIVALAINMIIAKIYFEPRPFVAEKVRLLVNHAKDASFPSDHVSGASALTFALWNHDKKMGLIMLVLTILIMFARVYVGVHYPFDVLAGLIIGYVSNTIVNKVFKKQFSSLSLSK